MPARVFMASNIIYWQPPKRTTTRRRRRWTVASRRLNCDLKCLCVLVQLVIISVCSRVLCSQRVAWEMYASSQDICCRTSFVRSYALVFLRRWEECGKLPGFAFGCLLLKGQKKTHFTGRTSTLSLRWAETLCPWRLFALHVPYWSTRSRPN